MTHYSIGSQIHSDASSSKNSKRQGSSRERKGKTGEDTGMAADESQKQERSDRGKQGIRTEKFISRH